jgi:hypothetical protein
MLLQLASTPCVLHCLQTPLLLLFKRSAAAVGLGACLQLLWG